MCSSKPSDSAPNSGDDNEIGGADPRSKFVNNKESVELPGRNKNVHFNTIVTNKTLHNTCMYLFK